MQVNGNDVRRASHQEAVTFLIAPVPDVYLTVRHDPPPPGLQVCLGFDSDYGLQVCLGFDSECGLQVCLGLTVIAAYRCALA